MMDYAITSLHPNFPAAIDLEWDEGLLTVIEDECGRCKDNCECYDTDEPCQYPIVDWSGGGWGMVANFRTGERGF